MTGQDAQVGWEDESWWLKSEMLASKIMKEMTFYITPRSGRSSEDAHGNIKVEDKVLKGLQKPQNHRYRRVINMESEINHDNGKLEKMTAS